MNPWQRIADAVRREEPVCRVAALGGPLEVPAHGGPGGAQSVEPDGGGFAPGTLVEPFPPAVAAQSQVALADGLLQVADGILYDPILPPPRLVIAGGGHVAGALVPAAAAAGFRVTVIDDRADYARPDRFADATVLCADPAAALADLPPGRSTFLVLAGRTHELDAAALRSAIRRSFPYVGMVGSRRKLESLRRELGDPLEGVRCPVGLDLGAETPAEIAVSIVAELIAVRRGGSGAPLYSGKTPRGQSVPGGDAEAYKVWLALANALDKGEPCALATVISVAGSTPRGPGARMLVRQTRSYGTVGGGSREAEVRRLALACIETRQPLLFRAQYVAEQDALCGGAADIFIEPIR